MPKQKTKKAAAKRFKRTAGGKIRYGKAGASHLLSSKTRKRKRGLRSRRVLSAVEARRVEPLLAR
ncbi:MAG: 50S ribosomal protein L35 [Lentisphaerae bacterium]|nr:50S ribosomal protein L35 [Lentisphaerota bacterium]